MTLEYLVTGATGGLGAQVLSYMIANLPPSEYAAASSRESNRSRFEDQGVPFRVVNYDEPHTLEAAFADVQNLLFVSTNTFDVERRARQHRNFVDAARKMGVKHVCSVRRFEETCANAQSRCGIRRLRLGVSDRTPRSMFSRRI
jgi:uncharacterized protein YbjT (DUF2867 family)